MDFQRRAGKTSRIPKVRSELEKNGSNKNNSGDCGTIYWNVMDIQYACWLTDDLSE